MFCGLCPPSSRMLSTAFHSSNIVGLYFTVMVHVPPAGILVPQVLTCVKWLGLCRSSIATLVKFKGASPMFVRITSWVLLVPIA